MTLRSISTRAARPGPLRTALVREARGLGAQPLRAGLKFHARRAFTLIELMVAIAILLILGTMIIGFLRGAMSMSRTGISRGHQYETAQVVMRLAVEDFSQVVPPPPRSDGHTDDMAFRVATDCWGRQVVFFTRAFGEELTSKAGYDAARGSAARGYGENFTGRNVNGYLKPTGGNIEVVYMLEPYAFGTKLYRAVQSPAGPGGLIDEVITWLDQFKSAADTDFGPTSYWLAKNFDRRFELVAENVIAFNIECWDDQTTSWDPGPRGPKTTWSMTQQLQQNKPALPYSIRLTVIVGADEPIRAESMVVGAMGANDSFITVEDAANFPDGGDPSAYVRVNGELIAYGNKSDNGFGSCVRGALGTKAQAHPAGSRARGGEAFRRVIQIPAAK